MGWRLAPSRRRRARDVLRLLKTPTQKPDMTFFNSFFRGRNHSRTPSNQRTAAHDHADEPAQVTILKTLVIVYDPVVEQRTGKKLSQFMHWNQVEDLAKGFMTDILQTSAGLAR